MLSSVSFWWREWRGVIGQLAIWAGIILGFALVGVGIDALVAWFFGVVLYDGVVAPFFGWRIVPFNVLFAILLIGSSVGGAVKGLLK